MMAFTVYLANAEKNGAATYTQSVFCKALDT